MAVVVAVAVTVVMVVDQRGTAARVPRTMSVYRRIMQINLVAPIGGDSLTYSTSINFFLLNLIFSQQLSSTFSVGNVSRCETWVYTVKSLMVA